VVEVAQKSTHIALTVNIHPFLSIKLFADSGLRPCGSCKRLSETFLLLAMIPSHL
jgi:hypothetical protein